MNKNSKIFVAGHKGLVGSAILKALSKNHYHNVVTVPKSTVDLTSSNDLDMWFTYNRPEYVFIAAAKVGGIIANKTYPAEFCYTNLMIQNNLIESSRKFGVKKLLFLGSSCIYPKFANQPITEDQLLSGYLEETNEAYAIAKIAGLKMCQYYSKQYNSNFISCMPTNLYGPGDNFDPVNSHVIPGLINKFISNPEEVVCWGDGSPKREFLYVDDMADACVHLMENYNDCQNTINVGTGQDVTIKELVDLIADVLNFKGKIIWDTSKPNGTPRKVLNVDKIKNLGWEAKTDLKTGIIKTIEWYKTHYEKA